MAYSFDHLNPTLMSTWAREVHEGNVNCDFENNFVFEIYVLAQARRSGIETAFHMRGGREGWLQVELALWLQKRGFGVEREVHVFNNELEAADLIVTTVNPPSVASVIPSSSLSARAFIRISTWVQDSLTSQDRI